MAQDSLPEPRNLLAGFLLMYLFGLFGVHQLYLGRKKQAWIRLGMFLAALPLTVILVGVLFYFVLAVWWLIDYFKIYIYRVDGQGQPLEATSRDERVLRIVFYGTIIATILYVALLIALHAAGVDVSRY